jgi:hypothetical protein
MAYFPLTINEELADLLRSATELNGLLNSYVKKHFKGLDHQDWQEYPAKQIAEMQNNTLDMITTISDFMGDDILSQALAELNKADQ